jgi:hypothetical protein
VLAGAGGVARSGGGGNGGKGDVRSMAGAGAVVRSGAPARVGSGDVRSPVLAGAGGVARSGGGGNVGKGDVRSPMGGAGAVVHSAASGCVGEGDVRSMAGTGAVVRSGAPARVGRGDVRSPLAVPGAVGRSGANGRGGATVPGPETADREVAPTSAGCGEIGAGAEGARVGSAADVEAGGRPGTSDCGRPGRSCGIVAWGSAGRLGPSSPSAKCTRDVPGGDSANGTGVVRLRSSERSRLRISGGGPGSTGPSAHAGQSPSGGKSAPHFRHLDTLT